MSSYIPYTEAEKEKARQTDIADMLMRQGETLRRSGSELEWRDGSAKVTIRGNLWFHQYDRTGGDAIDFVRRFYNKSYPEAMEFLLGGCGGTLTASPPVERKPPKPFELPKRSDNMRRVYAYLLNRRGIDRDAGLLPLLALYGGNGPGSAIHNVPQAVNLRVRRLRCTGHSPSCPQAGQRFGKRL